jgi:hypothetical protein
MWSCAALEKGPVVLLMYLTGWFLSTIGLLVAGTNCKACAERDPKLIRKCRMVRA